MSINSQPVKSIQLKNSLVFNNSTSRIIELGMHAFADTFLSSQDLCSSEPIFPLNVVLDPKSGMIHNEYITPADDRYNYVDYSYTSSNSASAILHWKTFLPLFKELGAIKGESVIEIGSNDGFLCSLLIEAGYQATAVDAAKSMFNLSSSKGIPSHQKIFNSHSALEIKEITGPMDYLIANNVLNHANDPLDFLVGAKMLLRESGRFIMEVPYWCSQIENNRFDMIYHEHLSYFTVLSLKNLVEASGMYLNEIQFVNTHGGSLRIIGGMKKTSNPYIEMLIAKEISSGVFTENYYMNISQSIKMIKFNFMSKLYENYANRNIFGIGAAAKANTFLTYLGLNSTLITAITDSSSYKIGKFTPLTRIPIKDDEILSNYNDPVGIILSWNIGNQIKKSLSMVNNNIEYLET